MHPNKVICSQWLGHRNSPFQGGGMYLKLFWWITKVWTNFGNVNISAKWLWSHPSHIQRWMCFRLDWIKCHLVLMWFDLPARAIALRAVFERQVPADNRKHLSCMIPACLLWSKLRVHNHVRKPFFLRSDMNTVCKFISKCFHLLQVSGLDVIIFLDHCLSFSWK